MKTITHVIAGSIAAVAGILCIPAVHTAAMGLAGKSPYLAIIIPAVLAIATTYHNPKTGS